MSCHAEMEILVSAYLDHEVTAQQHDAVEQHLRDCTVCQATVASWTRIHQACRSLEMKHAPPDFRQHMTQRLDQQPWWGRSWQRPRLRYACAFVVVMVFGGVMATLSPVWFHRPSEPDWGGAGRGGAARVVNVYAEDILFGGTTLTLDHILAVEGFGLSEEPTLSEELLDSIEFFDQYPLGVGAEHARFRTTS
jgi:hypothetical protein